MVARGLQGLPRRIRVAFIRHAVTACIAVAICVVMTGWLARELLVDRMLQAEAASFWRDRGHDPAAPLPRSHLVQAWFLPVDGEPSGSLPAELRGLAPGRERLADGGGSVLVQDGEGGRMYMVLRSGLVDAVVMFATLVLLLVGTVTTILITRATYLRSKTMVLPVNRLAEAVSMWDPSAEDAQATLPRILDSSREVQALTMALQTLAVRVGKFVQRERDFTRDASHELRTPLTVIRVAVDTMRSDPRNPDHLQRPFQRIDDALTDMEALVNAFLILARERGGQANSEGFELAPLVRAEMDKASALLEGKPVRMHLEVHASPRLVAPPQVMSVVVGHLISNACKFTDEGEIEIALHADHLMIRDTGIGMSAQLLDRLYDPFYRADRFKPGSKGIGLSIVRRLGDRFGWPVTHESQPGVGTTATIHFQLSPAAVPAGDRGGAGDAPLA